MKLSAHRGVAGLAIAAVVAFAGAAGAAEGDTPSMLRGVPLDQVEQVVDGARIQAAISQGASSAIWEALEHAERVECLDCIPAVEPLLYDRNPRTREIAAWWLRRRLHGVFGPDEVYARAARTLASDPSAERRAHAADALGEMLTGLGATLVARALTGDPDATVRAAAARALGRLNDDGKGALGRALGDQDARVKVAALAAAGRINAWNDVPGVSRLLGDTSPLVRRRAVELLDAMRARDAVAGVMALAKGDPDADVRMAACHALGAFGDAAARPTLLAVAESDPSGLVKDHARIALRRL